jgi:5-formyltetrahydrofolate cyclo-ligase
MAAPHIPPKRDPVQAGVLQPDPDWNDHAQLDAAKQAARRQALAARAGCDPAVGAALSAHVLAEAPPPPGAVVAGFWPLAEEIDVAPLLIALIERGHRIALPVTPRSGLPLAFREWRPDEALVQGRFGTMHTQGAELVPGFLLVPLLAFDRRGRRLGFGAGYYDRTIAMLPGVPTLGCGFAAQEFEEVPAGPHDAPLDAIATERGVIFCKEP